MNAAQLNNMQESEEFGVFLNTVLIECFENDCEGLLANFNVNAEVDIDGIIVSRGPSSQRVDIDNIEMSEEGVILLKERFWNCVNNLIECMHEKLSANVVSTYFNNGNLVVISCVCCDKCGASWTATDGNAYKTS